MGMLILYLELTKLQSTSNDESIRGMGYPVRVKAVASPPLYLLLISIWKKGTCTLTDVALLASIARLGKPT